MDKWHIPSRDVYIQLFNRSLITLEREFAKLCLVIPSLDIYLPRTTNDNSGCYITNKEIAKKVTVKEQEIAVHVYHDDVLRRFLHEIDTKITSKLLSECLQILTEFWVLYSNRKVRNNVSVLHICELTVFCLKKEDVSGKLFEALHGFLKCFTDIDVLFEFQRSSILRDLEPDDIRLLQ